MKGKWLRVLRVVLALLMFVGITWLLLDVTGWASKYLGWMAKIQLFPAILSVSFIAIGIVLLSTLMLGRLYCSVVCPMGVLQDIVAWVGRKLFRKRHYRYHKPLNWLRWTVLGVVVLLVVFGLTAVSGLVDPYSAYGRVAAYLLKPVWVWGNNIVAHWAELHNSDLFYHVDMVAGGVVVVIVAVVTLLVIGGLSLWRGRLWCNTICPVGTLLGQLSRLSIMKPVIDKSKCVGCGSCPRKCKAECINSDLQKIDYSRCVACMDCIDECKAGAISFKPTLRRKNTEKQNTPIDGDRRKFLVTTAAVGAALALQAQEENIDGGLAAIEERKQPVRQTPLRPAGSDGAARLSHHCTGCGLCVSACPSHILLPSKDLKHLMQPELSYKEGYCRIDCNRCSQVCPTAAIKPISVADKVTISIGHAVVVKENCISAAGNSCGKCASACPVEAVKMVTDETTGYSVPAVDEGRCLGCGKCEYLCPSRPLGGIYVEGNEQHHIV